MKQFAGLVKKDFYWMRTEIFVGLVFYGVSLYFLPLLLQKTLVKGVSVHEMVIGMASMTVVLGMFLPGLVLLWLLHHDMKHPDIWLHTPARSAKLFSVKVLLSSLTGIVFMLLSGIVVAITYFGSGMEYSFTELVRVELFIFSVIFYFPFVISLMALTFWVVYQVMRPVLGRFSLVIAIIAFIVYAYVYTKFQSTELYGSIFNSSALDIGNFTFVAGDFSFGTTGIFSYGDIIFDLIVNISLAALAIMIFNKKVRC